MVLMADFGFTMAAIKLQEAAGLYPCAHKQRFYTFSTQDPGPTTCVFTTRPLHFVNIANELLCNIYVLWSRYTPSSLVISYFFTSFIAYAQECNIVPRSRPTIQLRYVSYACCTAYRPPTFDVPLCVTITHISSSSSARCYLKFE